LLDERFPRGVTHLGSKWEVTPEIDTRPCHAQLELPRVQELQRGSTSNQLVRVWRKSNMYALQPRRTGKSLSRGKEARMAAM
jgi:hypothetical protein